ncbi:MAG TPA: GNAT family N-acetyltransferase [Candidatus Udaeobacter sp.]|nr:GNAT family N-acetyltransferase [Candidatus Udaeobacter sp.]
MSNAQSTIGSVRRAGPGDEAVIRQVRLAALADAPVAFESTLERERTRTEAEWRSWIERGAIFLFERAAGPGGLAAGIAHTSRPQAAFLVSMWVAPELRGTGAADRLVAAVIDWAAARGDRELWLHVTQGNARAQACYARNGFHPTGETLVRERDGAIEVEMRRDLA